MAAFEMNVQWTVDLSGLDTADIERQLEEVVFIAARNIEKKAKAIVPVDTGATKNSIFVDPGVPAMEQRIGPTTYYAPFIEFGTRHWAGVPFMIPSAESEAGPMRTALTQVYQRLGR